MSEQNSVLSDARLLADAIMEDWKKYDDNDNSPKGYYCNYCFSDSWHGYKEIVHDLDCPVLVAKDILTNRGKQ